MRKEFRPLASAARPRPHSPSPLNMSVPIMRKRVVSHPLWLAGLLEALSFFYAFNVVWFRAPEPEPERAPEQPDSLWPSPVSVRVNSWLLSVNSWTFCHVLSHSATFCRFQKFFKDFHEHSQKQNCCLISDPARVRAAAAGRPPVPAGRHAAHLPRLAPLLRLRPRLAQQVPRAPV